MVQCLRSIQALKTMKTSVNKPATQAPAKLRAVAARAFHISVHGPETPVNPLQNARHALQEEIVVEGLLHITTAQAGSCLERFGSLDSLTAPSLEQVTKAMTVIFGKDANSSNRVISAAICLATPPDPTETDDNRPVLRQVARPPSNRITSATRSRAVLQEGAGELLQLEAHACQRTVMLDMYTAEVLQASAHVRRQRRRALVRALHAGKETARGLLQAPGATLAAAFASLDGSVGGSSADEL